MLLWGCYSSKVAALHLESLGLAAGQKAYPLYMGLHFCLLKHNPEHLLDSLWKKERRVHIWFN